MCKMMMMKMHTSQCRRMLSLEEAVVSLEADRSPQPSVKDFAHLLQRCGKERDRMHALRLHAYMRRTGMETHSLLGNFLVPMLVEVGSMHSAQHVFDKLIQRNEWSWNALITGYVNCGKSQRAVSLYHKMQRDESVHPSGHTFVAILKACKKLKDLEKGTKIHAEAARVGFLEGNLLVGNAIIDMYSKSGSLEKAQKVFDNLPARDVVSWNALIAGYAEHGPAEEAIHCFDEMQREGVIPSAITFVSSLKACGSLKAADKIHELHIDIEKKGLLQRNVLVGTILVDIYAKCGLLKSAQHVFDCLPARDAVSWTALISGYSDQGYGEEAIKCFEKMQFEGVFPDAVAFLSSLKACGNIGAIEKGVEIHAEIERQGLIEKDAVIGTTLVDMYGKCGLLAKAQQVFDQLRVWDVVSCNALMTGYAQLGQSENVSLIFDRMLGENIKPDPVTFIIVLSACSRRGVFHNNETFFDAMSKDHGIIPSLEHHACMVDLLGRAGRLDMASEMIKKMQVCPNLVIWHTILSACRKWGNLDCGTQAFEHALRLDKKDGSAYVFMSHIYAATDLHE